VPRVADPTERRDQIADALLRIAATQGLHRATMRSVAAEAGVSVNLVQYYFHTKEELLFFALKRLSERSYASARERIARARSGRESEARHTLECWLTEMLPLDGKRRAIFAVFTAYHSLSLTNPELAALPYVRGSHEVAESLSWQLGKAQQAGEIPADIDPLMECANLMALVTGLGSSLMSRVMTEEEAVRLLEYQLDKLFGPTPDSTSN
jgi:AcrR family transcriptional regulator